MVVRQSRINQKEQQQPTAIFAPRVTPLPTTISAALLRTPSPSQALRQTFEIPAHDSARQPKLSQARPVRLTREST